MRKRFTTSLFAGLCFALFAPMSAFADVICDATNFPDANFRAYLLECDYVEEDDIITDKRIAGITYINVYDKGISSLEGIQYFTALTELVCYSNQLTSLDVSKNTALRILDCNDNQLTSLDVSNNTALTELNCAGNQLTSLDVSNNTALRILICATNQLTSLDVSNNTALRILDCSWSQLTSLDVSNNTALTELYCGVNQLTSLDVYGCTALTKLECNANQLTSLDVSGCTALVELECSYNKLTRLDVSGCTALTELRCYSNQLYGENMDKLISSLPNKSGEIYIYISTKETEGNVCTKSQVAAIKEKGWTPYYFVPYTWLEYGGYEYVQDIAINEQNFPDENFRNWLLEQDYGKDGVITDEEIAEITKIDVSGRQISNLEGIQCFIALEELNCSSNQLTSLDLSKNTALARAGYFNNQLTALEASGCTALTRLYCYNNKISGVNMDILISSLPNIDGDILIYDSTSETEGNVCTKAQVAAIKAKGWTPYYYDGKIWLEYEGSDDADGIIATEADNGAGIEANTPAYDLNGKRVEDWQSKKGVYIVGGKKVVVK